MTLSEFQMWFEGFTEDMDAPPNEEQWKRIKARVKEITGSPLTERIYIDHYLEPFQRWAYLGNLSQPTESSARDVRHPMVVSSDGGFDGHEAMLALGRAEVKAS